MAQKPSIPKGTRDFSPTEMVRRNYIFDTIKSVFQLYGYLPIETPAMENLSTLLGKYGEEGDKLLFRILNSGDYLNKIPKEKFQSRWLSGPSTSEISPFISEKGLRYDLTVPFARYVVQHRNDITFPFKRYQIQPVWRSDRPQKGRYREFYQCDVDVIGSDSLLNEVEQIQIIDEVFKELGIKVSIKINNRKILYGIAEVTGETDKFKDITTAIDKLDKIGINGVTPELQAKGISNDTIYKLMSILDSGPDRVSLSQFYDILKNSEIGMKGVNEIQTILGYCDDLLISNEIRFVPILARGLNYYTGTIIEVTANDVKMGSLCGGGRYDNLTGIFGLPNVSGMGVSFGADRIYDVMLEKNLFPKDTQETTQVMFVNFGEKEQKYCLPLVHQLRSSGINAELFPESAKLKKQMNYANNKNIPFVVLVGDNEMEGDYLTVKNMNSGEQKQMSLEEIIGQF